MWRAAELAYKGECALRPLHVRSAISVDALRGSYKIEFVRKYCVCSGSVSFVNGLRGKPFIFISLKYNVIAGVLLG